MNACQCLALTVASNLSSIGYSLSKIGAQLYVTLLCTLVCVDLIAQSWDSL